MIMKHHFSFISGSKKTYASNVFLDSCSELGYFHREIDIDSDIYPRDIQVVYIENCSSTRVKLENYMKKHRHVAALGVLEPGVKIDSELAQYFCDFINLPCNNTELNFRMKRACVSGIDETEELTQELLWRCNLVGESPRFVKCMDELRRLSKSIAPILLYGETGTGKELAARAIHYSSNRQSGPFIPVNCAALPDSLLENELFGHERGAYTDANSQQKGLVAQANGGTLFLDEVDSLSTSAQAVLLRFVQDGTYRSLGSNKESSADLRIVAASNRNLGELVEQKLFRHDLRYRLEVFTCTLPPLRERDNDPLILARYFARQFCAQYGYEQRPLHPVFEEYIINSPWYGNVRELENEVHRAVVLSENKKFIVDQVNLSKENKQVDLELNNFQLEKSKVIKNFEFKYLTKLMKSAGGNVTKAAKIAGKERRALGKLLKKYSIAKS